jgi:threonyl-tRNA synthetase
MPKRALAEALMATRGLPFDLQPGEGAFYGPKIEFTLKDCLGRLWQCGTIQLDFAMPERLGAEFVGEDGGRHARLCCTAPSWAPSSASSAFLIEHYAGAFPAWLAPVFRLWS